MDQIKCISPSFSIGNNPRFVGNMYITCNAFTVLIPKVLISAVDVRLFYSK